MCWWDLPRCCERVLSTVTITEERYWWRGAKSSTRTLCWTWRCCRETECPVLHHHTRHTFSGTMKLLRLQLNAEANSGKFWREPRTLQTDADTGTDTLTRLSWRWGERRSPLYAEAHLNFPGLWRPTLTEFSACSGLCVPHHTWEKRHVSLASAAAKQKKVSWQLNIRSSVCLSFHHLHLSEVEEEELIVVQFYSRQQSFFSILLHKVLVGLQRRQQTNSHFLFPALTQNNFYYRWKDRWLKTSPNIRSLPP